VRNAGHRNFYRRGRIYYRVKNDIWVSLHTTNRREALKRLRELEARDLTAKTMEKMGFVARLHAIEEKISSLQTRPNEGNSLAPWFANPQRGDFAGRLDECISRMQDLSAPTKTMWRTQRNNLVKLLSSITEFDTLDLRGLDPWEKFEKLEPSGAWNANRKVRPGHSNANQMATFLRKFVSDFVERGFLPTRFIDNANAIKKLEVHGRTPKLPSPAQMEKFLARCEERDWKIGRMLRTLAYSGARKGIIFNRERALSWSDVDFETTSITFWQKGDIRRRVPMGPQLRRVLLEWRASCGENGRDNRVFPFGSGVEDRALRLLKEVSAEIGDSVADMTIFHNFRHYFKTEHQLQGTPDSVSDFLSFNSPPRRRGSGDGYRHGIYELARRCVERVEL
jgi:integrase